MIAWNYKMTSRFFVIYSYPLDWELSERKLRVLFGNDASVVCIFHVPLLYPNDPAKLVHVSNMPEEINVVTLQVGVILYAVL